MASSGKRKADDGTSSVVVEAPPAKVLRLRQSVDDGIDVSALDVDDVATVQHLSRMERRLHTFSDPHSLLTVLIDKLRTTKLVMIRTKLVRLLRKIVCNRDVDCTFVAEELSVLLMETESHQFKNELLALCSTLCSRLSKGSKHFTGFLKIAEQCLKDRTSSVRASSLLLVGDLIKNKCLELEDTVGIQLVLIDYIKDPEPRVRSVALNTMVDLHQSGTSLDSSVYDQLSPLLYDDYERVRSAALRLVTALALANPTGSIKSASVQPISMLDDGFAKVCDAINDISVMVRTQAAQLMAKFVGVSQHFLDQTLDKKLMSNMRRKQSSHERQREFFQSGEWSSGKRFADDAPKESITDDAVSLISMGACGAFVHALEDEFMEVRGAAIESMCILAQSNPSYARQTQDFLVDMFNDEIEAVRLQAIHALCKIAGYLCLRDDQVEIITGVLKDYGVEIRHGIHRLIQACHISTHNGLKDMLLSLLDNLRKFPDDKHSIWRVMKDLGTKHPGFISLLLPELLSIDPNFEMAEPNMDDVCYVAVMLAVYNAAANKTSSITMLFPSHTKRHYRFHRNRFPHLVPLVPQLELSQLTNELSGGSEETAEHLISHVQQQLGRVDSFEGERSTARVQLLTLCLRDLTRLRSREDGSHLAEAAYLSHYIKCMILFCKVDSHSKSGSDKLVLSIGQQIVDLCEKMVNLYINVPPANMATVKQLQLLALTLILSKKVEMNLAQPSDYKLYLERLSMYNRQLSDSHLLPCISNLLKTQGRLKAGNWSILRSAIGDLDLKKLPLCGRLPHSIDTIKCHLVEPVTRADNPKKFTAGLAISLPVRATITNVDSNTQLYVKVMLPDQSEVVELVKSRHVTRVGDNECSLSMSVVFSHGHWTEKSCVEVVVMVKTDSLSGMLEICPPNKVYINTKQEKKSHSGNIM